MGVYVMFLKCGVIVEGKTIDDARLCVKKAFGDLEKMFQYNVPKEWKPTNYRQVYEQVSEYKNVHVHRLVYFNEGKCRFEPVLVPRVVLPKSNVDVTFDRDDAVAFEMVRRGVERELKMSVDEIGVYYDFIRAVVGDDVYIYYPEYSEWRKKAVKMYATMDVDSRRVVDISECVNRDDKDCDRIIYQKVFLS